MTDLTNQSYSFINPSFQTPLFTAEWVTCAYPVSDLWAPSPRYLYYVLLLAVLVTQRHFWLTNVFLGVAATYAGTAAIESFVLTAYNAADLSPGNVTIPYVANGSVAGNATLDSITNLITDMSEIWIKPQALDFDIDAVIAITVTGYLMMLPMHCWSSAVRAGRARHLLILIWNALMAAGAACSIVNWPVLYNSTLQYRFCFPTVTDFDKVTSDGLYTDEVSWFVNDSWNDTVWAIFSNYTKAASLPNNCFYPCFNTTQIMRQPSSLIANLDTWSSPRVSAQLATAGYEPTTNIDKEASLANVMYFFIILTTLVMFCFLLLVLTTARDFTRVPIGKPRDMLSKKSRKVFSALLQDCRVFWRKGSFAVRNPRMGWEKYQALSRRQVWQRLRLVLRFFVDIFALLLLFFAMVITPCVIVVWVYFIEWYIWRDLTANESPAQVGQWSPLVSVALILVSALILQLKYKLATRSEIEKEITDAKEHIEKMEKLLATKPEGARSVDMELSSRGSSENNQQGSSFTFMNDYRNDFSNVIK